MRKGNASLLGITFGFLAFLPVQTAAGAIITGSSGTLNGHSVNSFADLNAGNQLIGVGFDVSGALLRDPGTQNASVFLTLPSEASATNFTTLELDWNPQGHPPPGVYDVPHFDFHFYYIPDSVRNTIPGGVVYDPGAQYRPVGYSVPGPSVPDMGSHSLDLTSPELNGGKFTQTFIYGYYKNQEAFVEPMATQAWLESLSGTSASLAIRQPSQYALPVLPSLVPTSVQYAYNASADAYTVTLGNFTTASPTPEPASLLLVAIPGLFLLLRRRT